MKPTSKIAIVGVGQVGGAAANAIVLSSIASEVLLVDSDIDRRDAQVQDLSDVAYSQKGVTRVQAATYEEAAQSDIIVITAGSRHFFGQCSIDYTARNVSMVSNIIKSMVPFKASAILLIVANPVDLLTSIAQELSGLPRHQVLGAGTFLDSIRLRGLVARQLEVAASSIDVYVLGVHGEAQVTAWSMTKIGGSPIAKALLPSSLECDKISDECREKAEIIMRTKGSTPYGIASVVASTCTSILMDKRNIRPLSHYQPEFGCCFSLPALIGRQGIVGTVHMPLNDEEKAKIDNSAKKLKARLEAIHKDCDLV